MPETWMQVLTIVGSNLVIMLTFFGVTIALHLSIREDIREMKQESKEFHGRLEKIDAEFKGIMAKQDAEFKGKLAQQDAEFKAHLMYHHDKKSQ